MSKMLVKSFLCLLVIVFGLTLSGVASAANFTANGNITISSVSGTGITANLLILNGSAATSWQFDSGVFTVTNPDATAGFQVGSSDSSVACLVVRDSSNSSVATAGNTIPGTSYVSLPTTAGNYTVTPSTGGCSNSSANPGSSSSGGGGGSGYTPPIVTPPAPVIPPPFIAIALGHSPARFSGALGPGIRGAMVKELQKFLNARGFIITASGSGAPGKETDYFGPATKAALVKFQLAKGIIKSAKETGAGSFGPMTMTAVNATLAGTTQPPVSSPATPTGLNADQFQKLLQVLRKSH